MSELHDDEIEVIDFEPVTETKRGFSYRFRWLHAFLAGFGSAALVSAWFVLTAKSVLVDVDPITAQIKIENGFALRVGARYLMRSGEYTVVLTNAGFHDETAPLVIGDDAAQTHSYEMRKLPGIVSINALPDGGRVRIDGVDVGDAPLLDIDVEPGLHEISVTRERYLPATQTIDIEGRRQQQAFDITLAPAWATVSFTTTPAGAELLVDGESVGTTPLNAEILQGRREVTLKLTGFKAWQERLDLDAGTSLIIPRVELVPADGLVFIKSQPSGASVTIGGEFKGQTPLEVALAPDVNHVITFFKNGYTSKDTRLTTRANEAREIEVELTPCCRTSPSRRRLLMPKSLSMG